MMATALVCRMLAAKLASPLKCPALLLKRSLASTQAGEQGSTRQDACREGSSQDQSSASKEQKSQAKAAPTVQLLQGVSVATLRTALQKLSCIATKKQASAKPGASSDGANPIMQAKPHKKSIYDPPEGAAKRPGTYRSFGKRGAAVYWPRMPCLRCGCPWWLGEDWDAVCVRCRWTAENDGYDDDSQPLKKGGWLERYQEFTALLKKGQTAPWPPVKLQ
jgi:hypothetical protein